MMVKSPAVRNLVLILGDQLDDASLALQQIDPKLDRVWMAEVTSEATHVWTHKARIAMFLAAMRHFRDELESRGLTVDYHTIEAEGDSSFESVLLESVTKWKPEKILLVEPGEWRVRKLLENLAKSHGWSLEFLPDTHFYCSPDEFSRHAQGRKQLRLEYFYRELRRKHNVLMQGKDPVGGQWNYDSDNRGSFGKKGPGELPGYTSFSPDDITAEVLDEVERRFEEHPGSLENFDWPVTRSDALFALEDFIENRLENFGDYQDAMWTEEPYLYHSRLSAALNLKLLNPREVVQRAELAYTEGHAPLNAVEGFIRQILGWREYVRGIYWHFMPDYLEKNALHAEHPLPDFFWTGETEMHCLKQTIQQTLDHGYAHHIQRLMVTGLFTMMLGVHPKKVHEWYLAVYVDAIEWVELPNSLGMSQFADGGIMASKPYAATGKYIQRMSNYCQGCAYDPSKAVGEDACPFTTLYWDFLARHQELLSANPRMSLQVRNLGRKSPEEVQAIRDRAEALRSAWKT
jgi:deoxyribodipyrimidine photolyase-related protein